MWSKIKHWSGWETAGTIFVARMEAFAGFVISVLGALDWSPLLGTDFSTGLSWKQVSALGLIILIKGIITEVVRRNNAKDI